MEHDGPTPEEVNQEAHKQRLLHDAELIRGGADADFSDEGALTKLTPTEGQSQHMLQHAEQDLYDRSAEGMAAKERIQKRNRLRLALGRLGGQFAMDGEDPGVAEDPQIVQQYAVEQGFEVPSDPVERGKMYEYLYEEMFGQK